MEHQSSKTERLLSAKIKEFAGDSERVTALDRARRFKRTWIELAAVLVGIRERDVWKKWGFESFDAYCTRELHLKRATADKLCVSYGFLKANAPKLARAATSDEDEWIEDYDRPIPSWQAVDWVARAEERGAADDEAITQMKRMVFDEGAPVPALSRKYREVAFPVDDDERKSKLRAQLAATARRLADLVAQPEAEVPKKLASKVEELAGELLEAIA
jgi:hypothetical protein